MHANILPDLYCPFPAVVNQHAPLVHQRTIEWARRFHIVTSDAACRTLSATNIGWLAAHFHPDASYEELQLVSDWYAWMFVRDDQRDESDLGKIPELLAAIDSRFLTILKGAEPASDDEPLAHALCDLRERLRAKLPATVWMRRFARTVKEHFDATVWEATNRARGKTPDLATYLRMRPVTGGMHVDTEFIQLAEGAHLPPEIQSHNIVRRLTSASNNAVCWANDIVSLQKELKTGDVHNLVLVLQVQSRLPLETAIERAVEMHNGEVRAYLALEQELPSFGAAVDANLWRYVSVLRARMRGNLDWSRQSERYAVAALSSSDSMSAHMVPV